MARALVASGVLDDAAFAAGRARRLTRAGRSRRAVAAQLAAKGVPAATVAAALDEEAADDVSAALAHLRRRRQGPFAPPPATEPASETAAVARQKAMGALARAGFARDAAEAALDMDPHEAETRLLEARRS